LKEQFGTWDPHRPQWEYWGALKLILEPSIFGPAWDAEVLG
jgi:hypothetical protein